MKLSFNNHFVIKKIIFSMALQAFKILFDQLKLILFRILFKNGSVIVFSEKPAFLDTELYCVDYSKNQLNLHICNVDYEVVDDTVKVVKQSYPYRE